MFDSCRETVSILHALIFGADGACVSIGISSLLWAFGAFMVLVVIAQFAARKLWNALLGTGPRKEARSVGTIYDDPPPPDDGPIR
ncbi:hypothetical protein [Yoonia sp. BS5-3]|uniref:Heme exporter protein D n=1 Tax=Yoonia phaeophyticola TaxID=3137369 RepID=A0ABZ2VBU8_9RHOB